MGIVVNTVKSIGTSLDGMPRVPKEPCGPYVQPDPVGPGAAEAFKNFE